MSLWEKLSGKSGKKRTGSGKDSGGGKNSGRNRTALGAQASGAVLPGLSAPDSATAPTSVSASAFTSGPAALRGKVAYSAFLGTNYGSTLQAFALYHTILSLGYDCEVVCCACFTDAPKPGKKLKQENPRRYEYRRMRYLFAQFINANFRLSTELGHISPPCSADQVRELESFDAFVCGSDQIWNPQSFWFSPASYLDFAPEGKRIAYAPSIGLRTIPEKLSANMRRWYERLRAMDFLSVREASSAPMIERITCREPQVVLDPTFLLSPDEWLAALPDPVYSPEITGILKSGRKYLLAYLLDHAPLFREMIEKFAAEEDLAVVWLTGRDNDGRPLQNCSETDPAGFVHLVANAEYVCADGFHGTCFALIFRKPFVFLAPGSSSGDSAASPRISDMRLDDLFSRLSIPSAPHVIRADTTLQRECFFNEWQCCCSLLAEAGCDSIRYLKGALEKASFYGSCRIPLTYRYGTFMTGERATHASVVGTAGNFVALSEPLGQSSYPASDDGSSALSTLASRYCACSLCAEDGFSEFPRVRFAGTPEQLSFQQKTASNGIAPAPAESQMVYDFSFDPEIWQLSAGAGTTVLRTLPDRPGRGHFAWIPFPVSPRVGSPCTVHIIFRCLTTSGVINFHAFDPGCRRLSVIHSFQIGNECQNKWHDLFISFIPDPDFCLSLMVGAYHLSGKGSFLEISHLSFQQ